ncbi:MAG TPA: ATP-binding protein, partial [Gemmataceae bacterium]|nr:ATP-binding protein [Gemmataceae bacterium]
RVIEALRKGAPVEDSRVELKAQWPDPKKAARQIGGHANAAHGEPVLWLIGVDEKGSIVGADREEMSKWWPQVESQFDGLAPRIVDLNIPVDGVTVVALKIESDRAPFVVNNPAANMDKEVPWREGTRVRSARRADLIRLLEPVEKLPEIDLLWAKYELGCLDACLFIVPPRDCNLVIAVHKCAVAIVTGEPARVLRVSELEFLANEPESPKFRHCGTEVSVDATKKIGIKARNESYQDPFLPGEQLTLSIDLVPAGYQRAATVRETLGWVAEYKYWEFSRMPWLQSEF